MKIKNRLRLTALGVSFGLSACNLGTTTTSDVQSSNGSVSVNGNTFYSSSLATGCKTITSNGSCKITFTYYTTGGNYYMGPLTMSTLNGYNSTISECKSATATSQTCNFTITNVSGNVSQGQAVTVYSNSYPVASNIFTVGGGI